MCASGTGSCHVMRAPSPILVFFLEMLTEGGRGGEKKGGYVRCGAWEE